MFQLRRNKLKNKTIVEFRGFLFFSLFFSVNLEMLNLYSYNSTILQLRAK